MLSQFSAKALLASTLMLLAGAILILNLGGYLGPAQNVILPPLVAAQDWVSQRYFTIRDLVTSPRDVAALQARIGELEAENAQLEDRLIGLQEQAAEAEVLGALLNYARTRPESRYLSTNVIGLDPSPFIRSINIGVGSDRGVRHGMPVVTDEGLVGRVTEVTAVTSRVQLITDPASAVNVLLQGSRADGLLSAQPNGELWVELIDQDASVEPGELVLTSGLGGAFPADIAVGRVVSVRRRDFEMFQRAVIQPTVNFNALEIVLLVTNFRRLEIAP
ncbi:MAG: rod shape-determining protein MreC [Chloroflexi bacterium]|nr:rod shape-determining protein MreC [Chloroflexota bacterium]MCI0773381.1 rod shape-determining protein MreC [Chloroflexota bacterium]MCI0826696.1 rod shape-determining protein MreC [Chloroflexota bacterium]MCI0854012.1 rod shape-determining protein MreC [Chloroflexota bacterium]MCI0861088.1 rod shape-determining protein MreC [Chloroflexota bacterium]